MASPCGFSRRRISDGRNELICMICEPHREFPSTYNVLRHLQTHSIEELIEWNCIQCDICTKWFFTNDQLTNHKNQAPTLGCPSLKRGSASPTQQRRAAPYTRNAAGSATRRTNRSRRYADQEEEDEVYIPRSTASRQRISAPACVDSIELTYNSHQQFAYPPSPPSPPSPFHNVPSAVPEFVFRPQSLDPIFNSASLSHMERQHSHTHSYPLHHDPQPEGNDSVRLISNDTTEHAYEDVETLYSQETDTDRTEVESIISSVPSDFEQEFDLETILNLGPFGSFVTY